MERFYGRLYHDALAKRWVATNLETHVITRLKRTFGRIALSQADMFEFPDDDGTTADLHWFFEQRYRMQMSPADRKRLAGQRRAYETLRDALEQVLLPEWKPGHFTGLRDGMVVRHYQAQAVEILRQKKSLLLGDAVGLGKTYTAAAALLDTPDLPAAIVVEPHLTRQWAEKIAEFTTLRVHVIKGTVPYTLPEADVYLFRYSNVLGWTPVFRTGVFKTAVYDEIQNLRNGQGTQRGIACSVLSSRARVRLGLSATPVFNYGIEIHTISEFLWPEANPLGGYDEFKREWCRGDGKTVGDPAALGSFMRENHLMLRRTKADVGQELERVNRLTYEIPYDEKAEREVEDLAKTLAIKALSGTFVERGRAARDLDALLRHATGVGKAKSVAQFVRILIESGEPVVLAGWHREFYDIVMRELKDLAPAMYTGSESTAAKARSKDDFLTGKTDILLMSLRSGAGVDGLQHRASTVVIGEFDWSPEVHNQLIGRLDREGQTKPVNAIFLFVDGGSDPAMIEVNGIKASQSRGITDPKGTVDVISSDDSRIRRLALDFLSRRGVPIPRDEEKQVA